MTPQYIASILRCASRSLCLAFLVAFPSASVYADEWLSIPNWPVPPSNNRTAIAVSQNPDGFVAGFFRDENSRVHIYFALPEDSAERLLSTGLVTFYRGDVGRGSDIKVPAAMQAEEFEFGFTDGRIVTDRIWHGEGPTAFTGRFRDILNSQTLCASFFTFTGQKDACWNLSGLHGAVESALEITATASPKDQAWHKLLIAVTIAGSKKCTPTNHLSCFTILDHCRKSFEQHRDVVLFNKCMAIVE